MKNLSKQNAASSTKTCTVLMEADVISDMSTKGWISWWGITMLSDYTNGKVSFSMPSIKTNLWETIRVMYVSSEFFSRFTATTAKVPLQKHSLKSLILSRMMKHPAHFSLNWHKNLRKPWRRMKTSAILPWNTNILNPLTQKPSLYQMSLGNVGILPPKWQPNSMMRVAQTLASSLSRVE